MNAIANLIRRVKATRDVINEELRAIIMEYSDVIIDMVANDQLYERGINGYGEDISSYEPYKMGTIRIKREKGQPTDRVTLRDTGAFHRSFRLRSDDEGFYIVATDVKTKDLKAKYGSAILRLSPDNIAELLKGYVKPELIKRIKHYL